MGPAVGMNTMIFAHCAYCTYSKLIKERYYPRKTSPVFIREGAWIAPCCILLAGVTIGQNALLGAGSVATKNMEPYTVVAGVPAITVKRLPQENSQQ